MTAVKMRRALAMTLLCAAAPTTAAAQEQPPPGPATTEASTTVPASPAAGTLALAEVLRSSFASYPLLQSAELERDVAAGDLLAAQGGFDATWKTRATSTPLGYYKYHRVDSVVELPTTLWGSTFFAGYRLGRGDFPSYYGSYETLSRGELRAGVTVPLLRNGPTDRRRTSITRAEAGRVVADKGLDQARLELERTATVRYWEWVGAGLRVAAIKRLVDAAEERDAGLGARVARGDLPAIERTDNQRTVFSRRGQLLTAERQLQQAAIELGLYLRSAAGAPVQPAPESLPGALPEPTTSAQREAELVEAALQNRPELARFDAQRRQAEAELAFAKNQRLPAIDVQVVGSKDFGADSVYARRTTVLEASVLVDIPLQNRVAEGRADAAGATLGRIAAQTRFLRDRVAADVRDARSALATAQERVDLARRELGLARDLERAERTRFDLGDSTLLVVNLREQAAADAVLREIEALLDYQRAAATIRAVVAGPAPATSARP